MAKKEPKFESMSEVISWRIGLGERLRKAEEEGDYKTVYEAFREADYVVVRSFKTTSVNQDMSRVPPLSCYNPWVKINPYVSPESLIDTKRLETLTNGIREQVGVIAAYKFNHAVRKNFTKDAKRLSRFNAGQIQGHKDSIRALRRLERMIFRG